MPRRKSPKRAATELPREERERIDGLMADVSQMLSETVDETGFCRRCNDYPCRCLRDEMEAED